MTGETERDIADRRVRDADEAIARQRALIMRLRMMRRDTKIAEETLQVLISARVSFIRHREALN